MDKLNKLLDNQNRVWNETKDLVERAAEESRDFTADEKEKYDALNVELDTTTSNIDRLKKFEANNYEQAQKVEEQSERAKAPEYNEVFEKVIRGSVDSLNAAEREVFNRAQSVGTDSAGGYTSSDSLNTTIVKTMLDYSGMMGVARTITTSRGELLEFPTLDDTSNTGALLAENAADAEQDLAFGVKALNAYKYTSKIVRISKELIQDSEVNIIAEIGAALGERLGRIANTSLTTGDGSSKPNGVVTATVAGGSGITAASSSAITFDEIYDLQHSVDIAYRNSNARFMFADSTLKAIRKLKDSNNLYLWNPGDPQNGVAGTIAGVPYTINNDMAAVGAGNTNMLFGDFSKYLIRQVMPLSVVDMGNRYAEYHQKGYVAIARWDGELLDTGALSYLRNPST